jgi:hypothetical protein
LCQKLSSITKKLALHATLPNLLGLDWLATPFPTDCHLVQLLDQSMEMPVSFPFFLPSSMHLDLPLSGYLKNTNCKITMHVLPSYATLWLSWRVCLLLPIIGNGDQLWS